MGFVHARVEPFGPSGTARGVELKERPSGVIQHSTNGL